jgi:hypothetical protein
MAALIGMIALWLIGWIFTAPKETIVEDHSIYMETIVIDENTIY